MTHTVAEDRSVAPLWSYPLTIPAHETRVGTLRKKRRPVRHITPSHQIDRRPLFLRLYLLTIRPHETRVDRPENNVDPPDGEPRSQKRFEEAERSFEYGHRLLINLEPEFFVCVTARQRLNSSAAAPLCEKKRMLPTRSILHNTKTARSAIHKR